jgi:uncharacterized delta-60 repeat protein/uncharacterized repeat protein (TIGR01451 family)
MSVRVALPRFASFNSPHRLLRLIFIALSVIGFLLVLTAIASAVPGDLDPSFGTGGIVNLSFSPMGMAIQPNGKIVVSGSDRLARYNSDGMLDATFGNVGVAPAPGGGHAVTIQPDGKIIVGGERFLARFNSNGSVDTGFGSGSIITIPFGAACDNPNWWCTVAGIAIDANGKIVIGGQANQSFAVARYTSAGQLDPSFNGGGVVVTEFNHTHFWDEVKSVFIQPDGKIVAVGNAVGTLGGYFPTLFALARYNVDGTLDNSFGSNGRVLTDPGQWAFVGSAVWQLDGKIVAVGYGFNSAKLARYYPNGSLDLTFGDNGVAVQPGLSCPIEGAVLQIDGKIVAIDSCFHLVRFLPDGQIDSTFGQDGVVTSPAGLPYSTASGLGLQSDSKLVVTGDEMVVRYQIRLVPLSQTVTTLSPDAGQLITYTVTLRNADPLTLTQVLISDVIPAELTWANQLHIDPPTISGTLGQPPAIVTNLTLPPWQAITLTLPMTVSLGVAPGTVITHSVTVIADQTPLTSTMAITTAGPPVAGSDMALTGKNIPVVIHVLSNDRDPNNDAISLVDVGTPLSGTTGLLGNAAIYTSTLDIVGTDTFTYTVSDGRFTAIGTVNIIVAAQLFQLYIPIQWTIGPLPARLPAP